MVVLNKRIQDSEKKMCFKELIPVFGCFLYVF